MTRPLVANAPELAPSPELYVALDTGDVLHVDDLDECETCEEGRVVHVWRDSYTGRLCEDADDCPDCGGLGLVERRPGACRGAWTSHEVRPLTGPSQPAA